MKNKILLGLVFLAVIMAGVFYYASNRNDELLESVHSGIDDEPAVGETDVSGNNERPKDVKGIAISDSKSLNGAKESLTEKFVNSTDLSILQYDLLELAEAGDVEASYLLGKLFQECSFRRQSDDEQDELVEAITRLGAKQSLLDQSWKEYERCRQFVEDSETLQSQSTKWRDLAALNGHPIIVSESLMSSLDINGIEQTKEIAKSIFESGNPEAILHLVELLNYEKPWSLNGVRHVDRENALFLMACDLGYDQCRPGSQLMNLSCGYAESACDPNMSYRDLVFSHGLSPNDADRARSLYEVYARLYRAGDFEGLLNH